MSTDTPPPECLGIFAWFGYRMPLPELFGLIRAAGFPLVSLWWEPTGRRETTTHAMPGLARDAGLTIESAHVPFRKANALWHPDPAIHRPVLDDYLGWLGHCREYGIPRMVLHAVSGEAKAADIEAGLESFRQLVHTAETLGITLALENTRRPDLLDLLFSTFPSPALGLCYDAAHDRLWPGAPPGTLARHEARLVTTHLADTDGGMDRHWLPGDGVIDWPGVMGALGGYAGPLMLEVMPYKSPGLAAAEFLALAKERGTWLRNLRTN